MTKVFKYKLEPDKETMQLPTGARLISVIEQHGNIVVYAMVNESAEGVEDYEFKVAGTGNGLGTEDIEEYTFLGTVGMDGNTFVFHIFYRRV